MKSLVPYIVFHGNCREAIEFYKETLNGEITIMQTFTEAPMQVPEEFKDRIFNSELKAGDIRFKASDDLPGYEVTIGNNISLYVLFTDKELRDDAFNKLAEGGKVVFPAEGNFGMLKDKFGIQWMLVCE